MKDKFTDTFINFVNDNFNMNGHYFIIYGSDLIDGLKIESINKKNVSCIENVKEFLDNKNNIKTILKYEKIIIHGLFHPAVIDVWYENPGLCAKTYIYLYGGDYYYEVDKSRRKGFIYLRRKRKERILKEQFISKRSVIFKNVVGIINILPEENDIVRRLYSVSCKMFYATYWEEKVVNHYRYVLGKNDNIVRVQVGNSAAEENDHIKILKELYKYRNENIEIYVPLSYGDKQYAHQVKKTGKKLFKEKFIAMEKYLTLEKYYEFQEKVDVAIFGMHRQQALGNIQSHLFKGNIVYLQKNSVGAHFFAETIGCKIRYLEDIKGLGFKEFSYIHEAEKNNNIIKMEEYYAIDKIVRQWKEIFEA